MKSYRTGVGTIRRYISQSGPGVSHTLIGIERNVQAPLGKLNPPAQPNDLMRDQRVHFLMCAPDVADTLVKKYGVQEGTWTGMEGIIGSPCRYVESATGMLVRIDVLLN